MLRPNKIQFMKSHKWICWCASREVQDTTHFVRCFRKTAKIVMSVSPSLRVEQPDSHWTRLREIWCSSIFRKSVEKSDMHEYFTWSCMYVCDEISLKSSRNQNCFSQKLYRKLNTHFRINNILPKIVPFMRMWKKIWYSRTAHRRKYKTARAHCMLDN